MEADDYAGLTEEHRTDFAEQVARIDGGRIWEIVRRTVEKEAEKMRGKEDKKEGE